MMPNNPIADHPHDLEAAAAMRGVISESGNSSKSKSKSKSSSSSSSASESSESLSEGSKDQDKNDAVIQ